MSCRSIVVPSFVVVSLLWGCSENTKAGDSGENLAGASGANSEVWGGASGASNEGGFGGETSGSDGVGGAGGDAGAGGEESAGSDGGDDALFATEVVSFTPGPGAGHGQDQMPTIVLGPPHGTGDSAGGTDVVSLGVGGEITLKMGSEIIDGPGPDFIVFENAFFAGGNPATIWKELGEVSVSEDGQTWVTFPCEPEQFKTSSCAGWRPVYSNPENSISPFDPSVSGGDPLDLAMVGVSRARYVRIRDLTVAQTPPSAGFDLDAIAVIHAGP